MINQVLEDKIMMVANSSEEAREALVLFGSDMYRRGLAKGAIIGVCAILVGVAIGGTIYFLFERRNKNE